MMNSLRVRIFLILFVILLIILCIYNIVNSYLFKLEYRKNAENQLLHIGLHISYQLERLLSLDEPSQAWAALDGVMNDIILMYPEVSGAFVFDRNHNLVLHTGPQLPQPIRIQPELFREVFHTRMERPIMMAIGDQPHIGMMVPVRHDTEVYGAIVTAMPENAIRDKTAGFIYSSLLLGAICFLASLLALNAVFARWVTKPLSKLLEVMNAVGRGELGARADVRSHAEFSELCGHLNRMLDQIEELMKTRDEASRLQFQFVQEQERRRLSEQLRHSMHMISSTLDENEVIRLILEQMNQFASFDRASIWMSDENGDMKPLAVKNERNDVELPGIDTGHILQLFVQATEHAEKEYAADSTERLHRIIIPVCIRQQPYGAIVLERSDKPFEETEIEYLLTFISQSSIALSNARMFKRMELMAITDELTTLYNRRYFYQLVEKVFEHAKKCGEPLSVAIFDLDYFKELNDCYGHFVGDEVLRSFAQRLHGLVPSDSIMARFGGEEFICLLPATEVEQAESIVEQIRDQIASTRFASSAGPIGVTMSIGISTMRDSDSLDTFLQRADEALYQAKANGRNRIVNYR